MKIPFKLPFFRRKKSDSVIIGDEVVKETEVVDVVVSEKDLLLSRLNSQELETIFFRTELDKGSISLQFVKKLSNNPTLLNYLASNVFEGEVIRKINDGNLRVSDIESYRTNSGLFQYDVFSDEDKDLLDILRRNIKLSDKQYAVFSFDDFERNISSSNYIDEFISSLIEGQSLVVNRRKAIPLGKNKLSDAFSSCIVVTPIDEKKYFIRGMFEQYYSGDLSFVEDTIIFISYNQLLEWIKDDSKKDILKQVQVVINDNFIDVEKVIYGIRDFSAVYNSFFSEDLESDKLTIQINHLLYLIDKSELDDSLKESYKYYIIDSFNLIKNYMWSYSYREKLNRLVAEIESKLNAEFISKATDEFNQLDIKDKKKGVEQGRFSAEIFLSQFSNLDNITSFEFLRYITSLNNEKKEKVLENQIVINKLKGLLKECSSDEYHSYEEICKGIGIENIFKVFDAKYVRDFFKSNRHQNQYRFFFKIMEIDVNKAVDYILKDEEYFKEFVKDIDRYSFNKIDYSLLISLIRKIEQSNLNVDFSFLRSIDEVAQYKLLKEDFNDDYLVKIVSNLNSYVQQFFYLEDKRFNYYLWNKFNILGLSKCDYKFPDDVVSKPEFFDRFKSTSMVQFRINVNQFLIHQPDIYFEGKIDNYEDELIASFDVTNGLFSQYKYLIDNIGLLDDRRFRNQGIDFLYDAITNMECRKYVRRDKEDKLYIDAREELINYLKWLSKRKLNEVIVDRLFKDNIYNVFLNIKEMLRFNKGLSDGEKVLNKEQEEFYNAILNIDNLGNNVILELYNKFKDKNVALMFYEDIQKLKNLAYDKIKEELFQPEGMVGLEDEELSNKYGVPVFDLRDKDYVILARCLGRNHVELSHNKRDCYTLLSSENSSVLHDDAYVYGYSGFDNDCILHMFEGDSFSGDVKWSELSVGTDRVNRIMTSREIATNSSWYSEVQIVNKKSSVCDGMFDTLRPSFLIVYDEISDKILEEAKRKNIPICIISHTLDRSLAGKIAFDDERDLYTQQFGMTNEGERRKSR